MKRRELLKAGAGTALLISMRPVFAAKPVTEVSPVLTELVRGFAGKGEVREGRVTLDIAPLVENGNSVPVEITVDSPMSATQHVTSIALFNEKNPQTDVGVFTLSPLAGRARVATRIRLATSQQLVAIARMNDGSHWTHIVEVVVTVASCTEE
jgi:sulfur-oxidizing protein SoxY